MRKSRIVFCNKVVEAAGGEPSADIADSGAIAPEVGETDAFSSIDSVNIEELERLILPPDSGVRLIRMREHVRLAITELDENEQEFVARFYYMGETYRQMAEASGRKIYSLEALHRRALKKLRKALAEFVESEFGVALEKPRKPCVICDSAHRTQIDALIGARPPDATWRSVMRAIAVEYGIRVATPQMLIGHQKYHQ
jgi:hypothetical protein